MCASPLSPRHAQPDWMGGGLASRQIMHDALPSAAIFGSRRVLLSGSGRQKSESHHRLVYSLQGKENWSSFSGPPLKQTKNASDRIPPCSRHVRPSGVQQRGLKKAAERPSAGSRETAGRSSAGSVTAAAVRKDKERKVEIEAWSAITVAVPHM